MMPMVYIGPVLMCMLKFIVIMLMIMPSKIESRRLSMWVHMMVVIMSVPMRMADGLMQVRMHMLLSIEDPERHQHQRNCGPMHSKRRFSQH